jgi:hypothetical protein
MLRKPINILTFPVILSRKIIFGFIILIAVSFFAWSTTTGSIQTLHCTQSKCQSSNISIFSKYSDLDNLDISFKLVGRPTTYTNENLRASQFNIFYKLTTLTLFIPSRDGSSSNFAVTLPNKTIGTSIHISIKSSQVFSVFEDGILVYTHRYEIPVFFVDPKKPVSTILQSRIAELKFDLSLQHASFSKSLWALAFYFLGAIFIGVEIATRSSRRTKKSSPSMKGFPFLFAGILWIISVGKWLIRRQDFTGNLNPGPFGPIGPFFSDIYQVLQAGSTATPFAYNATDYPPFAVAIGQIIRIFPATLLIFLLFSISVFLFALPVCEWIPTKTFRKNFVLLVTLFLSYPILFGVLRGNFDLLAISLTLVAFHEYQKGRFGYTIVYLSLAIVLKYWPIIFLLIFLKNRQFNLTIKIVSLTLFLTLSSCAIYEHQNMGHILKIILKPFFDYGTGTNGLSGYAYSYSMGSIFLAVVLFFTAQHPLRPTKIEAHDAVAISQGVVHVLFIILFLLLLIFLTKKCKRLSSLFLYFSIAVLLIPSSSAIYRAGVLVACLVIRSFEGDISLWRFMHLSKLSTIKKNRLRILKLLEASAWLVILAPTDLYYQPQTFFSIASFLQPLSLCVLIFVEFSYDLQSQKIPREESFRE